MNEETIKKYTGFIGIVRPGEDEVDFKEFSYSTEPDSVKAAFEKIQEYVTKTNDNDKLGEVANTGILPSPFEGFSMFMNYDQFDPNIKYNFGFFGTPVFGNAVFLKVEIVEDKHLLFLPIEEKDKAGLNDSVKRIKAFEKEVNIYDSMNTVDKNEFLKEYVEQKNSILEESTKDIKGDNYDELQEAKRELDETIKND